MHLYSKHEIIIANIPYMAMLLIGAATIYFSCSFSPYCSAGVYAYLIYGAAGAFWIMIFVCPYCRYYATRECPCGYGAISARIMKKQTPDDFAKKFKRHIPVIVPLWVIPLACGGIGLWRSFSWGLEGLVCAFFIESWIFLPMASRKHGCVECPQRDQCPWMGKSAGNTNLLSD